MKVCLDINRPSHGRTLKEELVRPHTQLFKQMDNQYEHSHESHRRKRRDGYPEYIFESSSWRRPLMGHHGFGDDTRMTGFYLTWSSAFNEPEEQRSKKWKD
jgi:hypothetical protein